MRRGANASWGEGVMDLTGICEVRSIKSSPGKNPGGTGEPVAIGIRTFLIVKLR